jgi:D-alanyl-lipoteichoic acid acyltransferase DltB (MBOAT superfamily)
VVFNSLHFVAFFCIVYALYRVLPHRAQNVLLLVASYYFYAAWDWRFLGLLILSTLVDYSCARAMDHTADTRRRRLLLVLSIGFNLSLLGFFKYFNFFAENFSGLVAAAGWHPDFVTLRVLLPIGISFYTFVTMSYVIDVYRGEIRPTRNLIDFGVFVAFFPHLVAGPILRATRLLPQIAEERRISSEQICDGLWLIAWGYLLKIFVADNLAPLVATVYAPGAHAAGVDVLIATYAFAFQILGDFAGYSNIARGTSKLMGIELIENFRFPYFVTTPQAFWRNWHISLSTWLRDYLYIPLGGNRGTRGKTRRNLFITMVLGGLWHGAAWTFVIWGAYHGALLILYRTLDEWRSSRGHTSVERFRGIGYRFLSWLLMFHLTCFGWLIFRAQSFGQIADLTTALTTRISPESLNVSGLLLPFLLVTLPFLAIHALEAWFDDVLIVRKLPVAVRYSIYAATGWLTLLFGNFGGADFIYFQF